MKKTLYTLQILLFVILIGNFSFSQDDSWAVKAVMKNGTFLDVKAIFAGSEAIDITAIEKEGDNHFMDIKVEKNGQVLPIKMVLSNDSYVPVKVIGKGGILTDVKAILENGEMLDIKGVFREGNAIRMAAVTLEEQFYPIKAVSPSGIMRDVYGVKFSSDNIEMEIEGIKILAHIKALPVVKVKSEQPVWNVKAISADGQSLEVVAVDRKGDEHPIKAFSNGGSFQLLDVKAQVRSNRIPVKLVKRNQLTHLVALDDVGRELHVKIKLADGSLINVLAGKRIGNIINISANTSPSESWNIMAISPDGDAYSIKGIKVKPSEEEGIYYGFAINVTYFAHVKALAPIN